MTRLGFFPQHYWIVAVPHFVLVAFFLFFWVTIRLLIGTVVFVGFFTTALLVLLIQIFALAIYRLASLQIKAGGLLAALQTNRNGTCPFHGFCADSRLSGAQAPCARDFRDLDGEPPVQVPANF